jgi:nucleoside-diphosphate-sugar epimerase
MAKHFCRWDPELKIVALRLSNVMQPEDYAKFPDFDADSSLRKWNLWAYIDSRDSAQAICKSSETPLKGYHSFLIANADIVMGRPNAELLAEVYPGVRLKKKVGPNETLQSIDKARRVLGYDPQYSWRTGVSTQTRTSE